eukprot:1813808-Pyramimonas_sp.AAC.1
MASCVFFSASDQGCSSMAPLWPSLGRPFPVLFMVSCVVSSANDQGCSSMALAAGTMHTSERCQATGRHAPAPGGG